MKIKTTRLNPIAMAVAIFSFCLTSATAQSAEITGELAVELQGQNEPNYEHYFARSELAPTIAFTDNFFVDGVFVLEPTDNQKNFGQQRVFDREGIFVEELKLNHQFSVANNELIIFAGKFNPAFGSA